MNNSEQIKLLEEEISKLPIGYISKKTINGKVRYYRQWTENGKVKSKYIKDSEYESVSRAIIRRKELQQKLKEIKTNIPQSEVTVSNPQDYETNVMLGDEILKSCKAVELFKKRDCYAQLEEYLCGRTYGRVCVVYGLRRTGKTTMLFQAISELPVDQTVYIKANDNDNMGMLSRDIKKLAARGYKYFFLDEVTLLEDFIDSAALLSDIYAMQGLKIVMSGTDSLGFWFAEHIKCRNNRKAYETGS